MEQTDHARPKSTSRSWVCTSSTPTSSGSRPFPTARRASSWRRSNFPRPGTAGGTAVVLSRLGAKARSFGAIGTDAMGDALLAMLSREGVDIAGLVRTPAGQTSASVIPVRPNGDRPAWHCVGANATFTLEDLDLDQVIRSSHLHLGGPEFLGGPAAGELLHTQRLMG